MRAIKINKKDNVAVVIKEAKKGDVLEGMDITLRSDVPQGHKVALTALKKGDAVVRYGVVLGYLTEDVEKGDWINEKMLTLPPSPELAELTFGGEGEYPSLQPERTTWMGYDNGEGKFAGTRNILGITTTVQCCAGVLRAATERIRRELLPKYENVDDVSALIHPYGCGVAIDAPPADATPVTMNEWGGRMFEHLPLAATMGLLSAIQSNVRNVETDVVNYLYKSIDAASYKFNVLVPLVIPESQYVIQGGQYKADIMLAAYDDTMQPIVSVGGQNLPVEGGRGKYVASASSVGMKNYEAKLQVPDPVTGNLVDYDVKASYEVGAPSLVVSATKMNAMYRGLPNPIEVSVAGVSPSDLIVSCTGGNMTRGSNGYVVNPSSAKEISIGVSAKTDGKTHSFGSKKFRVYDVPDPVVTVVGSNKGNITRNSVNNFEVKAELKNFVFDVSFQVTSFVVSTTKNGFLVSETVKRGSKLTKNAAELVKGVSRNGRIYVESVKAKGPDGRERSLNGVTLKMQ